MSSARISAHKGGTEVLPNAPTARRASDASDPAAGFAAALGAAATTVSPPSVHHFHGADDASTGDDRTDTHAADESEPAAKQAQPRIPDAAGDTAAATPAATLPGLPGLTGWFAGTGNRTAAGTSAPAGQRGPAKPSAAAGPVAAGVAAAAIAASLVTPAAPAPTLAVAGTAGTQPVPAAAQLAQPGFEAPVPAAAGSLARHPHAASIDAAPADDTVAASTRAAPSGDTVAASPVDPTLAAGPSIAADPGAHAAAPAAADPASPVVAAALSTPLLTQAPASPAPTGQADPAALAITAPAVAAMVNTVAPSAGGSGARDFADTARDGQAAAAAAFSGVAAASAATAAAGGVGVPSAATASGPNLGGDAGAGQVATQLSGQVLRLLANSGHEAVVRLYPPDLGEVTVRIAISGRDVSAWFGSPQPAVQQTISLGLGQLQTDLGNAGYSLNNAWVGADASGYGSRGDTAPPAPGAAATTRPVAPVTPLATTLSSNSGVSIYV